MGNLIHYKFFDDKIRVGQFEMQYNEFLPVPELFTKGYTWFYNTEYANAIYHNFYFRRARDFYVFNIVFPIIFLTYLSFFTYLLDMRVGERLSFSMALALVIIASQIVTFDLVPVSSRWLWIDKIIAWSFYWVVFVVIQSVVVGYLYYLREDHEAKTLSRRNSFTREDARANMMSDLTALRDSKLDEQYDPGKDERENSNGKQNPVILSEKKHSCFYTLSLRKFDYFFMAFSFISYTAF